MFERMIAISWCLIYLGMCYLKEFVKFAFFQWQFRFYTLVIFLTVIEK